MSKFKVFHKNGQTKTIIADNLDEAEQKANKLWKDWIDLKMVQYCKPPK